MKLCVTAEGEDLDSLVDPRFGRCAYFLIIDRDSLEFEVIENGNSSSGGGAGIQSGQLIASKGVTAVITGNVGPNAFRTLEAAGIDVITGASGRVQEVVDRYKAGEFKSTQGPSVESKFGMS
jgi:predicted Fe-Mo cluster-binding NifX family protein